MLYTRRIRVLLAVFLAGALGGVLTGCGGALRSVRSVLHMRGSLTLWVQVAPLANHNSPIAVDVVMVQDGKLLKQLLGMSAQDWFAKRTDLERTAPGKLHVASWEWVPGQKVGSVVVRGTAVADGVVLFANYATKGDHRALLPRGGKLVIQFAAKDFELGPAK
jgi:type VI secretion system protein